uniref:Uncharacterized protein n=1 Tax=Neobodo designis TaxID=312471 RepID=A0A7S1QSN6_NEODS|mmetsp:Transcript_51602/g.159025  ORF Transcript_51602/g.159025 Transcript_51602/m.159025 type:complete len:321 (+) Transcript_51602:41-1003(+)
MATAMPRMAVSALVGGMGAAWYFGKLDPLLTKAGFTGATMGNPPEHEVYPNPFHIPADYKSPWPREAEDMIRKLESEGPQMESFAFINDYADARILPLLARVGTKARELRIHLSFGSITDLSLVHLLLHMPLLRLVDFERLEGAISDQVLSSLVDICKDLESIRIRGAGGYEDMIAVDKAVEHFAKRLGRQLKHLDLSEDMPVSDEGLSYLAEHCPNLELLNVQSGFSKYTDEGVMQVLRGCRKLQHLDVSGMNNVTSTLLAHIAVPEMAPSLKVLRVTPWELGGKVEAQFIQDLRVLRPDVKVYACNTEGKAPSLMDKV